MRDEWWPWVLRAFWVALPFALGPAIGDALADTSRRVQLTGTIGVWVLWAIALVCMLVPHTIALTPVRLIATAAPVAALWALVDDGASGMAVVGLGVALGAAAVSLIPHLGAWYVNGSSYGDERRLPLRPPTPIVMGPLPLAWVVIVTSMGLGPMLIAARQYVLGALVLAVGLPALYFGGRAMHALARRWLVFVPAGMVLHDPMAIADPVLIKRNAIERFGPALAGSDAVDVTMAASGLALEVRLRTPANIALRPGPGMTPEGREVDALLFTPTLPGVVLDEAERRRIAVG